MVEGNRVSFVNSHDPGAPQNTRALLFRITNVRGLALTVRADMKGPTGEGVYQAGPGALLPPLVSTDYGTRQTDATWQRLPAMSLADGVLEFTVPAPDADCLWIADQVPYTASDLAYDLHVHWAGSPFLTRRTLPRRSREGRPIVLLTITAPNASPDLPVVVLLDGHPREHHARWRLRGAIDWLLGPSTEAAAFRRRFVLHVLPNANPDGVANGFVRTNAAGVDINRNYDVHGPSEHEEPCIRAVHEFLDALPRLDVFGTHHCHHGPHCVQQWLEAPLPPGFADRLGHIPVEHVESLWTGGDPATIWPVGVWRQYHQRHPQLTAFLVEGGFKRDAHGVPYDRQSLQADGVRLLRALAG